MKTRVIEGFPDYEVSDTGVVISRRRGAPKVLQSYTRRGYSTVGLSRDGERVAVLVHRLVLAVFVGPCPDGLEGCHNDGDKANNSLSNLRYDTRSENVRDQLLHGTHTQAAKTHCPQDHPYDGDNLTFNTKGGRVCRACSNEATRRYRAKRRSASSLPSRLAA